MQIVCVGSAPATMHNAARMKSPTKLRLKQRPSCTLISFERLASPSAAHLQARAQTIMAFSLRGDYLSNLRPRYFQKLWTARGNSSGLSFSVDEHDAVDQVL